MTLESQVEDTVDQMRQNGFAVIEGLITEERLANAQRDAEALYEVSSVQKDGPRGVYPRWCKGLFTKSRWCKGLFTKTRVFDDLYIPRVLAVVEAVIGTIQKGVWGGAFQFASCM